MSNIVEFILRMKDLASGGMRQFANTVKSTMTSADNAAHRAAKSVKSISTAAAYTSRVSGRSIATLERALRILERKRTIMVDNHQLAASYRKAQQLRHEIDRLKNVGSSSGMPMPMKGGGGGMAMSMFKGAFGAQAVMQAGTAIINGVGNLLSSSYSTAITNTQLKNAINATTGGKGDVAMQMTSDIADKYGLDYMASLEGVKTLTGGLMSLNMPLENQMKIFEGVSTGAAAMGLTIEQQKGAFLALGQMASKGTVSAEELRGQLGERIPGAFGMAAKAMNVTEAQLNKMLQTGSIAASDFLPKFAAEMQKAFGEEALKNANGPIAVQNRFHSALDKLKATIGEGIMPMLTPIMEKLTTVATAILPYIQSGLAKISTWFQGIIGNVNETSILSSGWMDYVHIISDWVQVLWGYYKKVFGLIGSIVRDVVVWIGKSELLKDVFWAIKEVVSTVYQVIGWIIDKLQWMWDNVLSKMYDRIESIYVKIKELLGLSNSGSTLGDIVGGLVITPNTPEEAAALLAGLRGDNVFDKIPASGLAKGLGAGKGKGGKIKSPGVTHSGPKAITINVNKEMIGKLDINSYNIKEGVGEMEGIIREMLLRLMASMATAT